MRADKRTRRYRLAKAMQECGVTRTEDVSFGRPRIAGTGIPCDVLMGHFKGGESIVSLAFEFDVDENKIEGAIRFAAIYPTADLPNFWTDPRTIGWENTLTPSDTGKG